MNWLHQCRLPGQMAIWLRRARPEAEWRCACGRVFRLEQRVVEHTGVRFWRWSPPEEREHVEHEPEPQGAFSTVETAWRDEARDDSERRIPDIRLGFQKE